MYEEKVRKDSVDGVSNWYWPAKDDGAWDGPVDDWLTSHKQIILDLGLNKGCVQAGGNCGLYPILLSQIFDVVYTVEPDEENYHFLFKNAVNKKIKNIFSVRHALGKEARRVGIKKGPESNVGMHTIDETKDDIIMTTVDDLLENIFLNQSEIDLIWFDIEGYEYNALLGSIETIKKYLPVIALERPTYECENLIKSMGYIYYAKSKMDTFYVHCDRKL